jgi:hypothetical protein
MYHRFRASHLDKMNEALLSSVTGLVEAEVIALDATGFSPTNAVPLSNADGGKPFDAG